MAGGSASEAKGRRVGSSGASGLGRCFCRVGTSGVGPGGILCSKEGRRCHSMGGERCHRGVGESRCVARGNHKMRNQSSPLSPEGAHTYTRLHSGSIYGPLYAQFYHLWPQVTKVTKVTKVTRVERGENVLSLVLPQHAFRSITTCPLQLVRTGACKNKVDSPHVITCEFFWSRALSPYCVRTLSLVRFSGVRRPLT